MLSKESLPRGKFVLLGLFLLNFCHLHGGKRKVLLDVGHALSKVAFIFRALVRLHHLKAWHLVYVGVCVLVLKCSRKREAYPSKDPIGLWISPRQQNIGYWKLLASGAWRGTWPSTLVFSKYRSQSLL